MTIGIDASRAFRKEKTGTEWYSWHIIHGLAQEIQQSDDQLILYTGTTTLSQEIAGMHAYPGVTVRRLVWPLKQFWTQGRLSIEMFLQPPDVLFIPAHAIPWVHPARTVTTIHDIGFFQYPECYSRKDLSNLQFSTSFAMRHASEIITISEFSKNEIVTRYGIDENRIHVIGLACDPDLYHPRDISEIQSVLQAHRIRQPYIISIGRIDIRKNTAAVISVFEHMKKSGYPGTLLLVGPLGFGSESVIDLIQKSAAKNHINHLGWIPEQEKVSLLCGADAMLFLSRYEGFGLPVLEAQSCGVPVVCSPAGAMSEVAGNAALYCNPEDILSCANIALQVVSNPTLCSKLREAGFSNVRRYSWQQAAKRTISVLRGA